jgi:hypothetical protein
MVGIYLALGVLVFVSRTFFPNKVQQVAAKPAAAPVVADNQIVELPQAA